MNPLASPLMGDAPMWDFGQDPGSDAAADPATDPHLASLLAIPTDEQHIIDQIAGQFGKSQAGQNSYQLAKTQGLSLADQVKMRLEERLAQAQQELLTAQQGVNPDPYNQAVQGYQDLQAPQAPQMAQAQSPTALQQLVAGWIASQGDAKTAMNAYAAPYQANQKTADAENKKRMQMFDMAAKEFGMTGDQLYRTAQLKRQELDMQQENVKTKAAEVESLLSRIATGEEKDAQRATQELLARMTQEGQDRRNNADNAQLDINNKRTVAGADKRTQAQINAANKRAADAQAAQDKRQQAGFKHQEEMAKTAREYAAKIKPAKGLNGQQSQVFSKWLGYKSALVAIDAKIAALRTNLNNPQYVLAHAAEIEGMKADIEQLAVSRHAAESQVKEARQLADTFGVPLPGDAPDPDKGPAGKTKGGPSPIVPGNITSQGTKGDPQRARQEARDAIAQGADPAKVRARLKALGINL